MSVDEIKLLLIEDEKRDVRLIQAMLGAAKDVFFDVQCADRLSAALKRLSQGGVDVVLLDLSLPDSSGLETFAKVHKQVPSVPIVVMTGLDDAGVGTEAVKRGAQDYLIKGQTDQGLLARSLKYAIERHRTQEELRRSDERFRALSENSSDAVVIVDRNLAVLYESPSFERLFGYKAEDFLGRGALEFIYPEDMPRLLKTIDRVLKNPNLTLSAECRYRHGDGTWHYLEAISRNLLDNPAVQGIIANYRDVTERKLAEQALSVSEDRFKDLVEFLPQAVFEIDLTGTFTFANRRGLEIAGHTQADIDKGLNALDLFVEEDRERAMELVPGVLKGKTVSGEFTACKKDGSTLPIIIHEAPIFRGKEIVGARGVVVDITDLKRNEEALRHSEEKLKDLVEKLRLSQDALSTPVVQIWDNVLALPLIGIVDDRRAQHVMEVLLRNIVATQSELVILDVTGVTAMDSQVASYVMQTARAASLLGASCILTGIQPDVAQTVIDLGLDMTKVVIRKDMREGLRWALRAMGYQLRNGGIAEAVAARR